MILNKLFLDNFRCIKHAEFNINNKINLFTGINGSGKTSIFESIQVLTTGKSFRSHKIENIKNYLSDSFTIACRAEDEKNVLQLGLKKENKLNVRVNGKSIERLSEITKKIPFIFFNSNSFDLIDGDPQYRRRFIDWWLFYSETEFHDEWLIYQRLLKQRNACLRNSIDLIDIWDKALAESGEKINLYRNSASEIIMREFYFINNADSKEFSWSYYSGWSKNEDLLSALVRNRKRDIQYGFTSIGPHRADIRISICNRDAKQYLSRGQKKILSLSMLMALASVHKKKMKKVPLFMLDDLAAELDLTHRQEMLEKIIDLGGQVFLTALEQKDLDLSSYQSLSTFMLKDGQVHML